jgi:general stress protein 26
MWILHQIELHLCAAVSFDRIVKVDILWEAFVQAWFRDSWGLQHNEWDPDIGMLPLMCSVITYWNVELN